MPSVLTSTTVVLFPRPGTVYLLERIVLSDEIIRFRFAFFRDHSISADNQDPAQKREVIPSWLSIKIPVGFFVFSEQNQLFQSLRSLQNVVEIIDHFKLRILYDSYQFSTLDKGTTVVKLLSSF